MLSGMAQKFLGTDFIRQNPLMGERISSSFHHPNNFGGYLVVVLPMILSFLLFYRPDIRIKNRLKFLGKAVILTLFSLTLICLGLTLSRGAWFAFFITLILMGFLKPKVFYVSVLIILIFMIFFTPQIKAYRSMTLFSDNAASEESGGTKFGYHFIKEILNSGGSGRKSFWAESTHIIKKFPIL